MGLARTCAKIQESMVSAGDLARWVSHNEMLCGGLTAKFGKSNLEPLLRAMTTGIFPIIAEIDKASYRQQAEARGNT